MHILLAPSVWNKGIVPPNIFFAAGATDENDWKDVTNKFLASGDAALSNNQVKESIEIYLQGIELLPSIWSGEESNPQSDGDVDGDDNDDETELPDEKVIEAIISLHTNYATALSYLEGSTENVVAAYRKACWCYQNYVRQRQQQSDDNDVENIPKEIAPVAASSYFYLGMTYQDLASSAATPTESGTMDSGKQMQYLENSARAYAKATKIDPNHWSSYANMGVVLADVGTDGSGNKAISLELYEEGIMSYQMAIDILAGAANNGGGNDAGPTDPPGNKNEVIAELQYRIGLCLVPFLFTQQMESDGSSVEDYNTRKCTLHSTPNAQEPNSPAITRSCLELAAYSFSNALQSYRYHDGANNALNLVTADATFGMSTDVTFVQNLFEEYASR